MKFSLYACKEFVKDYVTNESDDYDIAFTPENIDLIASEMRETSTQFTYDKLRTLIQKLNNTNRLNKPRENKMPEQTQQERFEILSDHFRNGFQVDFPDLEPVYDQYGEVLPGSGPSHVILSIAWAAQPILTRGFVKAKIAELASGGLLQRKQTVLVVERQPTVAEIAKAKKEKFQIEHSQGFHNSAKNNRTELDRDDQHNPPVLTEEQRVAINAKNRRIDEIVTETLTTISRYTGHTHARTAERRALLNATFDKFKFNVKDEESALKLQRTIDEQVAGFDKRTGGGIR
jgi:hypothetical protein